MFGTKPPATLVAIWEATLEGHIIDAAWSPGGTQLAAALADGPISIWSASDGRRRYDGSGHKGGSMSLSWSRDGLRLATAGHDGRVRVLDPVSGADLHALDSGAGWAVKVAYCPTSDVLASAAGRKLRFWSADGRLLGQAIDHPSTLTDLAWRPKSLVPELASSAYGGLKFWTHPTEPAGELDPPVQPVRHYPLKASILCVSWAPNGSAVATGNQDASVHFWYTKTGIDLEMSGYTNKVRELAWDSTSRFLATGGGPSVTIWDCGGRGPANTQPLVLEGHALPVSALAYQQPGPLLAVGSQDGTVTVWPGGRPVRPIAKADMGSPITRVAWSPNNAHLAVAAESGRLCVFRPNP